MKKYLIAVVLSAVLAIGLLIFGMARAVLTKIDTPALIPLPGGSCPCCGSEDLSTDPEGMYCHACYRTHGKER